MSGIVFSGHFQGRKSLFFVKSQMEKVFPCFSVFFRFFPTHFHELQNCNNQPDSLSPARLLKYVLEVTGKGFRFPILIKKEPTVRSNFFFLLPQFGNFWRFELRKFRCFGRKFFQKSPKMTKFRTRTKIVERTVRKKSPTSNKKPT